jgi:GH15 family glucan-1,4-alpha-glucosidase
VAFGGGCARNLKTRTKVFLASPLWHLLGRTKEARELFERLLALRNDLGLVSEEYDPRAKRQLGNFPQAFSDLVLV